MTADYVVIRRARATDLTAVRGLLTDARLPVAGVDSRITDFFVAERHAAIVGVAGLELYGSAALLRSVAVAPALRGTGLGQRLTAACIEDARARGIGALALLTETAEGFFPRFGFAIVPRAALPGALRESDELKGACPESAVSMLLDLTQAAPV